MEKMKVTKEWAEDRGRRPCPKAKREFFKRWPRGLTLNRRNLYVVARECPISWLVWFGARLCLYETSSLEALENWRIVRRLASSPRNYYVTAPAKKRAFAKALADLLDL